MVELFDIFRQGRFRRQEMPEDREHGLFAVIVETEPKSAAVHPIRWHDTATLSVEPSGHDAADKLTRLEQVH